MIDNKTGLEMRLSRTLLGILFFVGLASSLSTPTNVTLTSITTNGFRVQFNQSATSIFHEIKVQSKFLSEDVHYVNTTSKDVQISGLKDNVVYYVTVRSGDVNGSLSNFSAVKQIRTFPSGVEVTISNPTQSIFTVFLEVLPGAEEWTIELHNLRTNVTTQDIVNTTYKIYRYLDADTNYSTRARVSKLESTYLSGTQSPYGNWSVATTKKLSLFGRVVLLDQEISNFDNDVIKTWEQALLDEYSKTQPLVSAVKHLQNLGSSSPAGVVFHHEIFVNGLVIPDESTFTLNDGTKFGNLVVTKDVNPKYQYGIAYTGKGLYIYLFPDEGCDVGLSRDSRIFLLNRHDGVSSSVTMGPLSTEDNIDTSTYFMFEGTKLYNQNSGNGDVYTTLQPNSVYSFDQSYLMKMCQPTDTDSYLYSRRFGTGHVYAQTAPGYNNTFTHSTGPEPVDVSKITYIVSGDNGEITVKMPAIFRAKSYMIFIDGVDTKELINLDSSDFVEATLGGFEASTEYCIFVSVTISHPNSTTESSDPECFNFYSGSPNQTSIRVLDVRTSSFKISFNEVRYATSYVVKISNSSFMWNVTATQSPHTITESILPGMEYNISVASQNHFGISEFSKVRSTKFWNFRDLTNNTMKLEWDNETSDVGYDIGVLQTGRLYKSNVSYFNIPDLSAGVVYDINVTAIDSDRMMLLLFTTKQITVPGIPTDLKLSSKTAFTAAITWESMLGADVYSINIIDEGISSPRNTKQSSISMDNLRSGSRYIVEIASQNSAGKSGNAMIEFVTDFAVPVNLTTNGATSDSIALSWSSINGAKSYKIKAEATMNGTGVTSDVTSTTSSVNIPSLHPGIRYNISVIAVYDEGEGSRSKTIYQYTAPAAPLNLRLISNEETSIEVAWDFVVGVTSYKANISGAINKVQNTTTTSTKFENLLPNRGYDVEINAINIAGQGNGIIRRFFTVFRSPYNVIMSNIASNSFLVNWDGSTDARDFVVTVTSSSDSYFNNDTWRTSPVNVTGLKPGLMYNINVVAIYDEGKSEPSKTMQQYTVPGKPGNLQLQKKEETELALEWDPVTGADYYRAILDGAVRVVQNTTDPWIVFRKLLPNKGYYIQIVAINSAGQGDGLTGRYFTVFQTPKNLSISSVQSDSFLVSWNGSADAKLFDVTVRTASKTSVFTSNTTTTVATNLVSGTNYSVQIIAIYPDRKSDYSKTIYQLTAPGVPTDIRLLNTAQHSFMIEWDSSTGADRYKANIEGKNNPITTTSTNAIFTNLTAGTKYNVTVKSHNSAGYSGVAKAMFETIPSTPNISVSNATETSITVSWPESKGATKYRLVVTFNTGIEVTGISGTGIIDGIKSIINGLNRNLQYFVKVSAISEVGESPTSQPLTVDTVPPPPTNVILLERTSTTLKLQCDVVNKAEKYEWSINGKTETFTTNVGYFSGLSTGTGYSIKLRAVAAGGRKSNFTLVQFQTLPSSPTVEVRTPTATSIKISWDSVKGAEKYKIRVMKTSSGVLDAELITSNTELTISNLTSGTNYTIISTSLLGTESSDQPNSIQATTLCSPPSGVTVTSITHNSVSIKWNPSRGASKYEIVVTKLVISQKRRSPTSTEPQVKIVSTSANISNLSPGYDYSIFVTAVNSAGESASPGMNIKTGASNPPKIVISEVTTSSVTLEWASQTGATEYKLHSRKEGATDTEATSVPSSSGSIIKHHVSSLDTGIDYDFFLTTMSVVKPGAKTFENLVDSPKVTVITVPMPPTGVSVVRSENGVKVSWTKSTGGTLYFIHVKEISMNSTYNTTDNSIDLSISISKNTEYMFTVSTINGQGRSSEKSKSYSYRVIDNTTSAQTGIPWWVWLIACACILIIIISLILWRVTRKRPTQDQAGFYDLQNPYRGDADGEIALDNVQMNDISNTQGHEGPQSHDVDDENPLYHDNTDATPILSSFGGGSSSNRVLTSFASPSKTKTDEPTENGRTSTFDNPLKSEDIPDASVSESTNLNDAKANESSVVENGANKPNQSENDEISEPGDGAVVQSKFEKPAEKVIEDPYATVNKPASLLERKNTTTTFQTPEGKADESAGVDNNGFEHSVG